MLATLTKLGAFLWFVPVEEVPDSPGSLCGVLVGY